MGLRKKNNIINRGLRKKAKIKRDKAKLKRTKKLAQKQEAAK